MLHSLKELKSRFSLALLLADFTSIDVLYQDNDAHQRTNHRLLTRKTHATRAGDLAGRSTARRGFAQGYHGTNGNQCPAVSPRIASRRGGRPATTSHLQNKTAAQKMATRRQTKLALCCCFAHGHAHHVVLPA